MLNKFLLPSEAPLSLEAFSARPPHGHPPHSATGPAGIREAAKHSREKPQKVTGNAKPR